MKLLSRLAMPFLLIASLLLPSYASAESATAHDVIVVGAGAAGMEAARVAAADGHSVLIIEAKDYIGGRVRSVTVGQTRVEAGAEEHYPSYETTNAITSEYGNSVYGAAYDDTEIYGLDGGTNTCWRGLTPSLETACGSDIPASPYDDFWGESCSGNETIESWIQRTYGISPGDRLWHAVSAGFFEGEYSASPSRAGCQSQINAGYSWSLSEDDVVGIVPHDLGYSDAMMNLFWQPTLDDANVDHLLSSPVIKIEEVSDGFGDYVEVTTATGGVHTAWRVITTVPIGVLQDEIIDFVPDLPAATVSAYNDIGFDDGFKIMIEFSRDSNGDAFWESEGPISWMVFPGTVGACWSPTNYKSGYPGVKDAILMCYPMGDNGTALNNTAIAAGGGAAGEQAVIDEVLAHLDVMFPNQLGQASSTHTGDYHVQNWGGEPYTRGVYSFETTTSWQNMGQNNATSRNAIRAAHYSNKLFFAGEHTNRGNGATVPGARQEGANAANNVDGSNMPNGLPPVKGPDTTAPVFTLNGSANMSVVEFTTFNDPGATADDDRDGNLSVSVSGSVDTNVRGTYTLTYSASDAAGNSASVTRTVEVTEYFDSVAPVITLNGSSLVSLAFEEAYVEQGATASDNDDGDVTANIVTSGSVDSSTSGSYTINYSVSDAAGNSASSDRTVTVGPEPGITLIPTKSLFAPGETIAIEYTEGSGSNKDWIGVYPASHVFTSGDSGSAEQNLVGWNYTNGTSGTISSWQSYSAPADGDYYAVLFSNDSYNFIGEKGYFSVGVVTTPDTTAPVITVNGGNVSVEQFSAYSDAGASANDDRDGNVSVSVSSNVDTNSVGSYTVTYSASDAAGNSASATRTVTVTAFVDTEAPVITLPIPPITICLGDDYIDIGPTATDNVDGDVSANIQTSGSVDTSTEGTYTITYTVEDGAGNSASATRTVTVVDCSDNVAPVITLNGASSVTLAFGEAYSEAGATASDDVDGDLTSSIATSGSVDSSTAGTYTISYSVSDAAGNSASATRSVTVQDEVVVDPDTISRLNVVYLTSKGELRVTANSSDGVEVELTIQEFGGVVMDELHPSRTDRWREYFYMDLADVPSSITVTSELGGTKTKNVNIKN